MWATGRTMLSFPALFLQAKSGAQSTEEGDSSAHWLFWVEVGASGVIGVNTPATKLPKAPDNPVACTYPPTLGLSPRPKLSQARAIPPVPSLPVWAPGELERHGPRQSWKGLAGKEEAGCRSPQLGAAISHPLGKPSCSQLTQSGQRCSPPTPV